MRQFNSRLSLVKMALVAGSALVAPVAAFGQDAAEGEADEIVVTGFRQSLEAALNLKRESVSAVDAIVAEDIAKFPDQNLAESLQRIPGISIQRDAGEGRAITVRGLGAQFTRVRVNGMETISTSTDGASANRDRAFDFNVFASELFTSLVVHKTAEASLDEGSLGAVVDLNTGNPLAGKEGFTLVASIQGRYNDLSKDVDPRFAGLIAWTNADKTFGISASVAWSDYTTLELGNNTVRWTQAPYRKVDGVTCMSGSNLLTNASAACVDVAKSFHPRIPRYGMVAHDRKRLGATGSIQMRPTDSTEITFDLLYSKFDETRNEYWGEMFRDNERNTDVSNYTIDSQGSLIKADFNNILLRTERYKRESTTEFYQLSAGLKQELSDRLTVNLHAGISRSDADIPLETTIIFDRSGSAGFSYDYSDMKFPRITFGPDATNATAFTLTEYRDRPSFLTNKFRNFTADFDWQATDNLKLLGGGFIRQFDFSTIGYRRDGTTSIPVTAAMAETFNLGNAGQPSGNSNTWIIPDLSATTALIDLYNKTPVLQQGEQRDVTEKAYGGWLMAEFKGEVLGMRVTGNLGGRFAKTEQSSRGFLSGQYVTVRRTYNDFLPSLNINLFPRDNLILRGAVAKVITRPTLGDLSPGGSIDQFNLKITSGNPFLEPYRATTFDVAAEWYFAPGAIFSVALFAKDIKSFPISSLRQGTFDESGFPNSALTAGTPLYCAMTQNAPAPCASGSYNPSIPIQYSVKTNGTGANLKGIEIALQLPFSTFSHSLRHFGFLGNVTFIGSDVNYSIVGAKTYTSGATALANPPAATYVQPLLGLAKTAWNATLYYDDGKLSVRSSIAYRSGYNDATSANGNVFEGYGRSLNVDASIRYKLTDWLELSLEGTNLTDDYRFRYVDLTVQRDYENNHYGRTFLFGARVKY